MLNFFQNREVAQKITRTRKLSGVRNVPFFALSIDKRELRLGKLAVVAIERKIPVSLDANV